MLTLLMSEPFAKNSIDELQEKIQKYNLLKIQADIKVRESLSEKH